MKLKMPKQEYTAEFKNLSVKRVRARQGDRRRGAGTGPPRTHVAELDKGGAGREAQRRWQQGGDRGTDGVVAVAGREHPTAAATGNYKRSGGVMRYEMSLDVRTSSRPRPRSALPRGRSPWRPGSAVSLGMNWPRDLIRMKGEKQREAHRHNDLNLSVNSARRVWHG